MSDGPGGVQVWGGRMSGHVETVTVSRCGDYGIGHCPGDDRGCSRCHEDTAVNGQKLVEFDADQAGIEGAAREWWRDQPFPTEVSHGEFIRQYGRCPDACEVAEQLEIADPADVRQGGER